MISTRLPARLRGVAPDLGVVLAAVVAVALMFPGIVLERENLWGDFVTWYYPSHEYAASRLRQGDMPLWNPYSDGGMPFVGEADHGTFYPLSWLLHTVAPDRARLFHALELFALLHAVLAILTLYAFLRVLGCSRPAALAGGLAYGLSGSFSARAAQVSLVCAQAWVPAALGGFFLALRRDSVRALVVCALAMGLIGLSGSPATLVVTLMGLALLMPATVLADPRERPVWARLARGVGALAVVCGLGLLLAAVQLLPMKEFVDLSERSAYAYEQVATYAVSRASLVMLLVPRFFGWLDYTQPSYWGPNNYVELSGYAGLLTLVLAALALRFRPWRETVPWLALAAFALWIALGPHGGLHWLVYRFVPVLGQMRAPGRYLLLWSFGVAVLGGLGLDAALREARGPRREAWQRWLSGGAVATGTLALVLLLIGPPVVLVLESWQVHFFVRGVVLAAIAAAGAALGLIILRRSATEAGAWIIVLLVANDLTLQGRGIGVIVEPEVVRELRGMGSSRYTHRLREDPSLYRVRNRYEGPGDLMLARMQSDFGPGRHVLAYQEFDERIFSNDSPLLDLMNVKYLGEVRHRLVESPTPSLLAQQYARVRLGHELVLDMDPVDSDTLEVVSTTFGGGLAAPPPGTTIGELQLESLSGETAMLPIRMGMETAQGSQSGAVSAAVEIPVTYFVDVTDAAAWRRPHYLARLHFPPLRVARIRMRAVGREWGLAFKEIYVVPRGPDTGGWRRIVRKPVGADPVLNVYENVNVMPRATLVSRARMAPSRAAALELISSPDFDPRTEVVLEGPATATASDPAAAGSGAAGTARIDSYAPERIALTAEVAPGGGWLVLSEVFFPGWTATVDGAAAATLRADAVFRAVRLEPGRHTVVFEYRPQSFREGLRLTGLSGGVLMALLGFMSAPGRRALRAASRWKGQSPPPDPG